MHLARWPNAGAWTDDVWGHEDATSWRAQSTESTVNNMVDDESKGTGTTLAGTNIDFTGINPSSFVSWEILICKHQKAVL